MAPTIDNGIIIVLDIGRNVSTPDEKNARSFFEEARECAMRILERKVMSQGKDLLGVILLGTKETNNNVAKECKGACRHITMLHELQIPTWTMIRQLIDTPSKSKGNWLDALVVAADHFKNGVTGVKITNKKVILMTNFTSSGLEAEEIEEVLNGYKEEGIEVDIFGPDIYDEEQKCEEHQFARQFVEGTNATTAPFQDIMKYLLFHRKKTLNIRPWNVDLSFGPNVSIPVSTYIRLRDEPIVKRWIKAVKDPVTSTASSSEGITRKKVLINTENQTAVEPDDVIKGYPYGQKIIPFNEADKSMLYESGDKCLSVYGFTHASNVTWQNLNGDGLAYIFGRKGDTKAQKAIRCLVECLQSLKLIGIVRRVYNKGNAPKMFALMPVIDNNNYICLSMAGICFKEEIKRMTFPPTSLKKYNCSDEQVNAFKNLIKAMDLTRAYDETYDDTEAFPIAETVSPSAQYVLDCIAYRAMNPDKPLPPPRDEIMMLFKQPAPVEKRAREPLEKLIKLFPLHEIETKKRKSSQPQFDDMNLPVKQADSDGPSITDPTNNDANYDMPKVKMPKKDDVERIGSVNPIKDFQMLISKGKSVKDLCPDIADVIENLFYTNLDGLYSKAIDTMTYFRAQCVESEPSHYNEWLQKFKLMLNNRKKSDVINVIHDKHLGLILKIENSSSTYEMEDSHDDTQAYENDTIPNSAELTIQSDINDMFDEM